MKVRSITLHTILTAALIASAHSACAQLSVDPTEPEFEKLIVFMRDAKDSTLLHKEIKVEPRAFTQDGERTNTVLTGTTDDGVIIIGLGGGTYDLAFEAEGYHPLLVKGCNVRSTSAYGSMVTFAHWELAFRGTVFTYTVFLVRAEGRKPEWRSQPFLSDTTYYQMPETLPQLLGGERALKDKLSPERLGGERTSGAHRSSVSAILWLERDGSIGKIETRGTAPTSVQKQIEQAVRSVRFTPAKILGNPVRSMLYMPFEFALDWKQK